MKLWFPPSHRAWSRLITGVVERVSGRDVGDEVLIGRVEG